MKSTPPKLPLRFFRWFCHPKLMTYIEGDLLEVYGNRLNKIGKRKADIKFMIDVLLLFRPGIIKPIEGNQQLNTYGMYKSYFKIGWRNILRNKSYTAINIVGLTLGMTSCLFIFLWVKDEKSFDNFHTHGKALFNIYQTVSKNGQLEGSYSTPYEFLLQDINPGSRDAVTAITLEDLRQDIPEIKNICSYATGYELPWGHPETFQSGEKIQKFNGSRAGKDFFTMLSYPVIAGDPKAALADISSMAISRKMAEFFFGTPAEAIGKSLRYENNIDFVVNAVFENVGAQSSLTFDFLINWDAQLKKLNWASPIMLTTLQLEETADIEQVEIKLNRFLQLHKDKTNLEIITVGLRPYRDRYLYSTFVNGKPQEGRMLYVRVFTGVALFILVIACINFMNLATARAVKRAKEVGIRKAIGSSRFNLIWQFFSESILLSFLALLTSVVLMQFLLPAFNDLTGKQIIFPLSFPTYWMVLFGLMLVTGLVAGSYPALYLSSLKPVKILKGTLQFTNSAIWFRKGLVCFQFMLSISLIIATIVVSNQTHFIENVNLGYNRDNLIYIQIEGALNSKYATFKERAMKKPGIAMVDRSTEAPHAMGFVVDNNDGFRNTDTSDDAINWEGKISSVGFKPTSVGFDFIKIMNLKVSEGRSFSKLFATDSADAFMINEEAVRQMGIKDPIGKWISAWNKKGHIIGVLKDYHTNTLREPIKPLIMDVKEYEHFGAILVRTEPGKTKEALANLEIVCKEINPNYPFSFQFIDQEYNKLYHSEQVVTKITHVFAVIGIVISCLGLFGLVMFAAEQRTKEIGIRKVLGATITSIVNLLSKDFLVLVMVSFLIAAPITGYFMQQWLQNFAYKIELTWWIFAVAGMSALAIAFATISIQAIQSAIANPVKSLRSE